jgi:hypothetical protein
MGGFVKHPDDEIIGKQVKVIYCLALVHDKDSHRCVCNLIGATVKIAKQHHTKSIGTFLCAVYAIEGYDKQISRREVELL